MRRSARRKPSLSHPPSPGAGRRSPHISDVFRDVLATLEKPPARPTNPERAEAPAADVRGARQSKQTPGRGSPTGGKRRSAWPSPWTWPSPCAGGICRPGRIGRPEPESAMSEPAEAVEPAGTLTGCCNDLGHGEAGVRREKSNCRSTGQRGERTAIDDRTIGNQQSAISHRQSHRSPATLSSFRNPRQEQSSAPPDFKPAWQVDRFTWPRVCRRLMARAAEEFDRLADALLAANARGQKVLAMAGCCRGEGATTLLLCAARRLAERGVKLVLVDADLEPASARQASRRAAAIRLERNIGRRRDVSGQCGRRVGRQQPGALGDPRAGVDERPNTRRLVAVGPVPRHPEEPLRNGARRSGASGKHRIDRRRTGPNGRRKNRRRPVGSQSAHHVGGSAGRRRAAVDRVGRRPGRTYRKLRGFV